jgi:hypothetical protein
MSYRRGVSLYSYQQSQFFKELTLEDQVREVGTNLGGADGIELIDEMSLRYPDPGEDFVRQWFTWMETYGTRPVAMDVGMDVLQFRDHVMSLEECADRLRSDLRLAKRLGFQNVRVLSTTPIEVMLSALPLAEELDIPLGKEIHQPMPLDGPQVTEILEAIDKTGTRHLGIVPDFGIFQTRPSEVLLAWYERQGAQPAASEASVELTELLGSGAGPFTAVDTSIHTAGNLRSGFRQHLTGGETEPALTDTFAGVQRFADERIENPTDLDYTVVAEALMFSFTPTDLLRELADRITHCHGKFYNMTEIPGRPGEYQDISIDYDGALAALQDGGFTGYVNTEYEGQRYFQDRGVEDLMSEVDQVRRHQEMLKRLARA